jgi:hypothetical protein
MFLKPLALGAAALPVFLSLAGCSQAPASSNDGACAAPQTMVSPTRVAPGQIVTVSAAQMWDGCNDQGSNAKLAPLKDQVVTLTLGGKSVQVARVSADPETGLARATVTIPGTAQAGTAALDIGVAEPAELTITAK